MADIATLGFAIDSRQAKAAATDLDRLTAASVKAEHASGAIEASAKRAGVSVEEYRKRMTGATASTSAIRQETERLERGLRSATKNVDATVQAKGRLQAASAAAGREVRNTTSYLDQLSQSAALAGGGGAVASVTSQVGTLWAALTRVHPAILATGLALGGFAVAAVASARSAIGIANFAGELKDTAETTGFTTDALQAFNKVGVDTGISAGKMQAGLERFTFQLKDAREGTGDLFDAVRKVDRGLSEQLMSTRDSGKSLEILAIAYERATTATEKSTIARAAFGRGGAGLGRFLGEISSLGGVRGAVNALDPLDRLTKDQIRLWDQLGDTITYNVATAKNNIVAAFAGPTLQVVKDLSDQFLAGSRSVRSWADSFKPGEMREKLSKMADDAIVKFKEFATVLSSIATSVATILSLIDRVSTALPTALKAVEQHGVDTGKAIRGKVASVVSDAAAPITQNKVMQSIGQRSLNAVRRIIGSDEDPQQATRYKGNWFTGADPAVAAGAVKGSGAVKHDVVAEQQAGAIKKDNEARAESIRLKKQERDVDEASKKNAVGIYNLEATRIARLGEDASPQEKYELEVLKSKSLLAERKSTAATEKRVMDAAEMAREEAITAMRIQAGVASEQEMQTNSLARTHLLYTQGVLKGEKELAAAKAISAREDKERFEQLQVRASQTPQLTRMALDARNPAKQFDQFATSSLSKFEDALVSLGDSSETTGEKFKKMTTGILQDLQRMLIRQTITGPLAQTISAATGSLFAAPATLPNSGTPAFIGPPMAPTATAHTGGVIGHDRFAGRYIHPAYFDSAERYHRGGMIGGMIGRDEVPIIARQGEGVFTPGQMQAMGGGGGKAQPPEVHIHTPPGSRSTTKRSTNSQGAPRLDLLVKMVDDRIAGGIASGGSKTARTINNRWGMNMARGNPKTS